MFKNVVVYRIEPGWPARVAQTEKCIAAARFVECGASQEKSIGWVEPRGVAHGPLVEVIDGQLVLKLMIETRAVPTAVVARKAKERLLQIESSTGRKPGKKETRTLKDDLRLELLPKAFSKQATILVWIDPKARMLVIDAASQGKSDEVVTALVKSLDGLALRLLDTQVSPTTAMSAWLLNQQAPAGFSIDRECELKAPDESKAVVRYSRHPLDNDEVKKHVEGGKLAARLALTWDGRVSFVLTDTLQLKKLVFLDGAFASATTGQDDSFDTDVAIATGELRRLLPDLLQALGGEMATDRKPV